MKAVKQLLSRLPITFTVQAFIYPILLFAALIFAQLHKTALSHIIFRFVLLLPLICAIYLFAARLCIRSALKVSDKAPEKKRFIKISAVISSFLPIPFPFVEAVLTVPDEKGFRLRDAKYTLALLPFSKTLISHSAAFAFRGEYDVRLSHIFVYDLSRSVRIRINVDKRESVFVMPRRLDLPFVIGEAAGTEKSNELGGEYQKGALADPSDTRPYIVGDSPKHIHWKLSSKTEDIIVREYAGGDFAGVNVICDLEARFFGSGAMQYKQAVPEFEDVADLVLCDSAVECTLAVASQVLERGNTVFLSWVSGDTPTTVRLENEHDLGQIFRRFAAEMPGKTKNHIQSVCTSPDFFAALPTIAVTPYIDRESADAYRSVFSKKDSAVSAEIMCCTPTGLFVPDEDAQKQEDDIVASLGRAGIDVTRIFV